MAAPKAKEYYCNQEKRPFLVFTPKTGEIDLHKAPQDVLKILYERGHKYVGIRNATVQDSSAIAATES